MTTKCVKLIEKKEFTAATLDLKYEAFLVYIAALNINLNDKVYPSKKAWIAHLKANKVFTKILNRYADFADDFSSKLAAKLPEHTRINDHVIELVDDQQPLYGPIYSLKPVELKILKTYIKNNLANNFIRPSKSPAGVFILLNKTLNDSLRLYVDY